MWNKILKQKRRTVKETKLSGLFLYYNILVVYIMMLQLLKIISYSNKP